MFFNQGFEPFSVPYRYEPQGCQPDGREYSYEYPSVFSSFFLRKSGFRVEAAGCRHLDDECSQQYDYAARCQHYLLQWFAAFCRELHKKKDQGSDNNACNPAGGLVGGGGCCVYHFLTKR